MRKTNYTKKKIFIITILALVIILVSFWSGGGLTGLCHSEMRYLSERELMDRYIFGDKAALMSEEEKKAFVADKWNGAVYPDCCRIEDEPFWLRNSPFRFLDKIIVGQYLYQFTYHKKDTNVSTEGMRDPYIQHNTAIDACGNVNEGSSPSIDMNETAYKNALKINSLYWKEKGNE